MKNTWFVKGKGYCSDKDLITFIKSGKVNGEDLLCSEEMKDFIKVKDSAYAFYLGGQTNETI